MAIKQLNALAIDDTAGGIKTAESDITKEGSPTVTGSNYVPGYTVETGGDPDPDPNLDTDTGDGDGGGDNSPDPVAAYGLDKADYFANTAEVTQQANAKLIEDQLAADSAALGVLEKTQAQNRDAGEQIYGAEYSNRQMTDKFGWTGGQLMDSETRMQALRDQLSAGILSNEQYIDTKYANDITKAKMAMVGNRMAIAQQAAKDAYSNALAMGQLTGVYIDPIASDLVGRYVTSVANNPDGTIDPALESQLIAAGFYKEVDGVKELHTEAIDAISGVINSLDRDSWTMGMKTALLEQGYSVDEVNNIMSTQELIESGEIVLDDSDDDPYGAGSNIDDGTEDVVIPEGTEATEEELETYSNGDTKEQDGNTYVLEDGQWMPQTFAGTDGKQVYDMSADEYAFTNRLVQNEDGSWRNMTDEEKVEVGLYKNDSGEWVDWWTEAGGLEDKYTTNFNSLYAEYADNNQKQNEYDAALEYFKGSNLANNSAELLTAMQNGSEITITATSDNKVGKGLYNDEFKITYTVNGTQKELLTRGANLLIAGALYQTDFGDYELLHEIYRSQSRAGMSGNEYDGANRMFANYFHDSNADQLFYSATGTPTEKFTLLPRTFEDAPSVTPYQPEYESDYDPETDDPDGVMSNPTTSGGSNRSTL